MEYAKNLEKDQEERIFDYVNNKLQDDLDIFENHFGYKGNKNLVIWLIIMNVFENNFNPFYGLDGLNHQIIPHRNFITNIKKLNDRNRRFVNLEGVVEFIPLLTPYKEIGMDGIGGYYFFNFIDENSPLLYYEHEENRVYKISNSFVSILKHYPIPDVYELLTELLGHKSGDNIKYDENQIKINEKELLSKNDFLYKMMKGINHNQIKSFYSKKIDTSFTPFNGKDKIEKHYNSIRNYYWYFFTGQVSELQELVSKTKNIKGILGKSIRTVFKEITEGNFKYLKVEHEQLEKIRGKNALKGSPEYKIEAEAYKNRPHWLEIHKEELVDDVIKGQDRIIIRYDLEDTLFIQQLLTKAQNIKYFSLTKNKSQKIPKEIKFLQNCEDLTIAGVNSGEIPQEIGELKKIKKLALSFNELNTIPKEIGELKELEQVSLGSNFLQDLPKEFSQLKKLKELCASENQFQCIPEEISKLSEINALLFENNLIEEIPSWIYKLSKLNYLDLSGNKIGMIPAEIGKAKSIKQFYLYNNNIKTISKEIEGMVSLETLDLSNNIIEELPTELFNLKNLISLSLSNNPIKVLPKEIGNLIALETLSISKTQLESIPEEIGQIKSLEVIYLNQEDINLIPESLNHMRDKFKVCY